MSKDITARSPSCDANVYKHWSRGKHTNTIVKEREGVGRYIILWVAGRIRNSRTDFLPSPRAGVLVDPLNFCPLSMLGSTSTTTAAAMRNFSLLFYIS